ncbi:MAG: TAXI family TRAP transporter solute-binding subunit [Geminicoccaceae bacterium]|nr:TAXI family TRAP transporter solute-binding subunit [Geminicoccaceae bacterium]
MRSRAGGLRAILGLLMLMMTVATGSAEDFRIFRIGTGGVAGTYFPIGGLLADAISNPPGARPCDDGGSCGVDGMIAIAQSSNGSIDNIEGIMSGGLDSGLAQSDIAYAAYRGLLDGIPPATDLRLVASLYVESMHLVVTADSGIETIEDIRGKRISLDNQGSGTQVNARIVLNSFGIGEDDITAVHVKPAEASRMILANELDGFFVVAGYPTPSVASLAEERDIRLVPLTGPVIEKMLEEYPFLSVDRIPADTYRGVPEIRTFGVVAQWVISAKADDQLVYDITKALWNDSSRKLLDNGHGKGRAITMDTALDGAGIPLHPGAERYYREHGLVD